jgi:hypothetical protein
METVTELPQRQQLLEAVLNGELTPAQAETEALRLGIGQLATRPDPARFDPRKEEWWTLPMTIAWIVWRTPEAVRNQWDDWRSGCLHWEECRWTRGNDTPVIAGHELKPMPPASWPLLALDASHPQTMTTREAHDQLWRALGHGAIEANAIDLEARKRVDVPKEEWKGLSNFTERGKDVLRADAHAKSGYRETWLPSAAVIDAWPARRTRPKERIGGSPEAARFDRVLVEPGTGWIGWDPDERDLLIERVRIGEISPEDAEAEAREKGHGPLATTPSPEKFDPFEDREWSIPMVLAWIAFRSPDRVRDFNDAWRSESWFWKSRRGPKGASSKSGWALVQRNPVTVMALQTAGSAVSETETLDLTEVARRQLWPALRDGIFEATGVETKSGKQTVIPREFWTDPVLKDVRGKESLSVRFEASPSSGFDHVRIGRAAVLSAWPAKPPPPERLPDLVPPEGRGFMAFSAAAQWIATKGGALDIGHDPDAWYAACRQLTNAIASADVACTGVCMESGQREGLAPALFGSLKIHHLFGPEDVSGWLDQELYLSTMPYIEEDWRAGFSDDLRKKLKTVWSKLMVSKVDVVKRWQFDLTPAKSGFAGRPTSKQLIILEFQQRCAAKVADRSLMANAKGLCDWLSQAHPEAPQPKPKTVTDHIRAIHNAHWAEPKMKISG